MISLTVKPEMILTFGTLVIPSSPEMVMTPLMPEMVMTVSMEEKAMTP